MSKSKYILFILFVILAAGASAQKIERDYIRKGNRLFNDSVFVDAEVNYRKALEVNPKSTVSMYNLGNTLSQQQKFKDAMEQYGYTAQQLGTLNIPNFIFNNLIPVTIGNIVGGMAFFGIPLMYINGVGGKKA